MIDGGAFVAAIATRGTEISKVVHLGRRPTALQRTALEYLSGGVCSIEGCTSRARLETDHVAEWATTHRTELAELAPASGTTTTSRPTTATASDPSRPTANASSSPPTNPATAHHPTPPDHPT